MDGSWGPLSLLTLTLTLKWQRLTLLLLLLIAIAGCAEPSPSSLTRSDSAGVEIIRHDRVVVGEVRELTVDSASTLAIGATEGPAALYRVSGAAFLNDGTILVVNAGTSEVRTYARTGELVSTFGRKGAGPGEFQSLAPAFTLLPGDTVIVFDPRLRRITVLRPDASVTIVTPVVSTGTVRIEYVGSWSGAAHLVAHTVRHSTATVAGVRSDSVELVVHDADGNVISRLPPQFSREYVVIAHPGGAIQIMDRPLGREVTVFRSGTVFATVDNFSEELRVYSPEGLERIVRRPDSRRAVSDEERGEFPASRFPGVELPDSFPSFRRAMPGTDALIWVERFPSGSDDNFVLWEGFDARGATVARVRVPGDLKVYQISREQLVGMERDSLGVEYVKVFQLRAAS